ncbi:globin-like [Dreissena polymorpha]|uniref:Globin n=1 Tax=Dreissena polymorpha TaxID=45954 RepID=A0A9D4LHZ8_DREPO|nr:globin-like [Dreissena polymorpha]KAH3857697.1 hypothetical protein DPMN_100309 [Dreissena polymorpha]
MPADSRPEVEAPCASTGLLASQKVVIATSWAVMMENPTENGVEMFVRLFKNYPDVQGHFAKLSTLSVEELKRSPVLIAHAQKALAAINHLVDSLDEPGELVASIQNLAQDHQHRGVTSDDFKIVLSTLQSHLAHVLKDRYDDVTATAWKQCCDVIWSVVDADMNKNS